MTKRAKQGYAQVLKKNNKFAVGFTIIETMLFLAIAGLIFAGLVAGTNGAIRQQRYKDSVQGFVDDLRDLYSLAENTQVLDYGNRPAECDGDLVGSGRGRSSCSVYGVYAVISPTHDGIDNVEAYWLIGKDQSTLENVTEDEDFFEQAKPGINVYVDDELKEIVAKKHSLLWGADISIPCDSNFSKYSNSGYANGCDTVGRVRSNNENQIALVIYRSPVTGSLKTMSALIYGHTTAKNDGKNTNLWQLTNVLDIFKQQEVSLCISSGAGMSYNGGLRMVKIDANGSNSNAVRLIEADSEENKCND